MIDDMKMDMDMGERLDVLVELRVVTEASIWLVRPGHYLRLPRVEGPRPPTADLDGALGDAAWHSHEGVWLVTFPVCRKLRVLPAGRDPGSVGLLSSPVHEISGG